MDPARHRRLRGGHFRCRSGPPAGAAETDAHSYLILAGAYLCGSLPTGLWLGRLAGVDVRATGSGNVGATNVARVVGPHLGIAVLLLDLAKGAVPVLIAQAAGAGARLVALTCLCTFYGHILPIFARFRGGKGVATAAGAFLAAAPAAAGCAVAVFATAAAASRIVSFASLAAGVSLPLFAVLLGAPGPLQLAALVVSTSLLITHRENLHRLRRGEEPRFRSRS